MPLSVQSGYLDSGSEKASTRSALSGAEARVKRSVAYKRLRRARRWRIEQSLISMTGVGNVAEPRTNTRGAFTNTPTLWNQDWPGVVGFTPTDSRAKARALSGLSYAR
jgi:hypothetical protein